MKKLLLIGLILLTGCNNPIGSQIDKEGDATRAEIQAEMISAKQEISAETQRQLEQIIVQIDGRIMNLMDYLTLRFPVMR